MQSFVAKAKCVCNLLDFVMYNCCSSSRNVPGAPSRAVALTMRHSWTIGRCRAAERMRLLLRLGGTPHGSNLRFGQRRFASTRCTSRCRQLFCRLWIRILSFAYLVRLPLRFYPSCSVPLAERPQAAQPGVEANILTANNLTI